MRSRVQRWGNSLALRIPKAFAADLGLEQNVSVELSVKDGNLIVRPVSIRRYELGDLLMQVTESNLHGEQDYGDAAGSEEW